LTQGQAARIIAGLSDLSFFGARAMAPPVNVFWKTTADFRTFDISVPSFGFGDNVNAGFVDFNGGTNIFADRIVLNETVGAASNNVFLGSNLTRSGQKLTGGDLQAYADYNSSGNLVGYIKPQVVPLSITQANAAMDTVSTADDQAFLRLMLSGSDLIELSGGNDQGRTHDYVFAGAGNDSVYGNRGNDTLFGDGSQDYLDGDEDNDHLYGGGAYDYLLGGDGSDRLFGGGGGDNLIGGNGADTLYGGSGGESLMGGAGNDRIYGDAGNDRMYGDAGADQFAFRKNHGQDIVYDFQDGVDKIRIEAPGGTNLGSFVKTQDGSDCIITNAALNLEITLIGVNKSQISLADDFLLVAL
jgi:Ca2+-binding RTX toxin-like protein